MTTSMAALDRGVQAELSKRTARSPDGRELHTQSTEANGFDGAARLDRNGP
ncbi:hypothetical protein ACVWZK_001752 [Bradyrhizobium sp. GM0.4]